MTRRAQAFLFTFVTLILATFGDVHTSFANPTIFPIVGLIGQRQKLSYTTAAQNFLAKLCSGVATIQTLDARGVVQNVGADLTVNLAGSGTMTFYLDSSCTTSTTSVTVVTGTSSANFYFVDSAAETASITASATSYKSGVQSETTITNPYVWTGGGANAFWSTAANWSGGAAPNSSTAVAIFDNSCSSNCSPNISASIAAGALGGIRMAANYTGTITQAAASTINVGATGWSELGGTFSGSASNDAIAITGPLNLQSGTFTSTSGTLTLSGDLNVGSPTFNHHSGTLATSFAFNQSWTVKPGTITYNNLTLNAYNTIANFSSGTMTIAGNLTFTHNYGLTLNSGTLMVGGNITTDAGNTVGTAGIQLTGNAGGQTVSGSGTIPNITIAAGSNPVTLSGSISISGNYIVTSVGTLTTPTALTVVGAYMSSYTLTPGAATYQNVTMAGNQSTYNLTSNMTLSGNLTLSPSNYGLTINTSTFLVGGDVSANTSNTVGSAVVKLTGKASGQTMSTSGNGSIPNLNIATGSNPVTLSGTVKLVGNYTVTSVGTLTTTGSTLSLIGLSSSSTTITPGTSSYNNVSFSGNASTYSFAGGTMTIAGNLSLTDGGYGITLNSGTLAVGGNVSTTGTSVGSGVVKLTGNASGQTVSGGGKIPNLTLATGANPATSLAANTTINSTMTSTSGSFLMSGFNLTISSTLTLNGATITKGGGALVVNGTTVGTGGLYGGTIN